MSATGITDCKDKLCRYYTPQPLADAVVSLLQKMIPVPKNILEPSVGGGAFARAAGDAWPNPTWMDCLDLDPAAEGHKYADGYFPGVSFLDICLPRKYELIIGNPPFDESDKHVMCAANWLAPNGVLAFVLSAHFFEPVKRHYVPLPSQKLMLSPRPRFTGRGDSSPYYLCIWRKSDFDTNNQSGSYGRLVWAEPRARQNAKKPSMAQSKP